MVERTLVDGPSDKPTGNSARSGSEHDILTQWPQFQRPLNPGFGVRVRGTMERYDLKWWAITLVAVAAISGVGMLLLAKFASAKLIGWGLLAGAGVGTVWQVWHSAKHVKNNEQRISPRCPNEIFRCLRSPGRMPINEFVLILSEKPEQLHQTAQVNLLEEVSHIYDDEQRDETVTETPLDTAKRKLKLFENRLTKETGPKMKEGTTQVIVAPPGGHFGDARLFEGRIQDYKLAIAILTTAKTQLATSHVLSKINPKQKQKTNG